MKNFLQVNRALVAKKHINFISNQGTVESESTPKRAKMCGGHIRDILSMYSAYIGTSRKPAGDQAIPTAMIKND